MDPGWPSPCEHPAPLLPGQCPVPGGRTTSASWLGQVGCTAGPAERPALAAAHVHECGSLDVLVEFSGHVRARPSW